MIFRSFMILDGLLMPFKIHHLELKKYSKDGLTIEECKGIVTSFV